jgi:predicted  nucleic acid-binding Zn-ribbon protein
VAGAGSQGHVDEVEKARAEAEHLNKVREELLNQMKQLNRIRQDLELHLDKMQSDVNVYKHGNSYSWLPPRYVT